MITKQQKVALGVAAVGYVVQTAGGLLMIKQYDKMRDSRNEIADFANRSAYLTLFLSVKLAEAGIELDEFDQRIMGDPPRLIDPDNPTMYADLVDRWTENSEDPDIVMDFLKQLKQVREADE